VAFRQHVLTEARRRLFRSRTFTAANAAAFLQSGAIFSAAFLTTEYFQLGLGYGPLATGLRLLPWTATPMVVAPLAGYRPALAVSAVLSLAGSAVAGAIGRRRAVARAASLDQRDGIPAATAARS
jgi:hypothetical protein